MGARHTGGVVRDPGPDRRNLARQNHSLFHPRHDRFGALPARRQVSVRRSVSRFGNGARRRIHALPAGGSRYRSTDLFRGKKPVRCQSDHLAGFFSSRGHAVGISLRSAQYAGLGPDDYLPAAGAVLRRSIADDFSRGGYLACDYSQRSGAGRHGRCASDFDSTGYPEEAGLKTMLDTLYRILALTRKELLAILKDPRSRFSLILPPILQCLIYGYVATYDLNHVPYAAFDHDRSAVSQQLLARIDGSGVFQRVANLDRYLEVKTIIDRQRALLVVRIDRDFERSLHLGMPAALQVIADGRNSNTARTAMGYLDAIVNAFNADWRNRHGQGGAPIRVTTRAWYNPNLETRWHMIPALIGTLTLIQTLLLTGLSVAREREQGTFDQLLVTPFRPAEIMAGKALPAVVVGIVQATMVLLVAQLWFQIPFAGSFVTLYVGLGVFLLAAIGIGLLLSSLAATMQQAMLFSFLLIMPFSLLSGLTTPISSMPMVLQYLTLLNPLRYAIDIAHRVYLEGVGLNFLIPELWPLALMAAVTLSAASWMFRHRLT